MSYYTQKMYTYGTTFYDYYTYYLFRRLTKNANPKILEIGCSKGNFLAVNPKNIIGVDIDKSALGISKKRGLNCKYMNINNRIKFPNNVFDCVLTSHVVEHLPLDKTILHFREIYRILKPGGIAIIYTPNIQNVKWHFYWDPTHINPFNKEKLFRAAYEAGFKEQNIIVKYQWVYLPGSTRVFKILKSAMFKVQDFLNIIHDKRNIMAILKK